jgi:leucyl aminopeptidase
MLSSAIADTNNISEGGYGGAITAALFLDKFVEHTANWVHIDMMAWNTSKRPGRPVGGEVMAARVLFAYLQQYYTPLQKK